MIGSFPIRKQSHFDVREQAVLFLIVLCELSSWLSRVLHRLAYPVSSARLGRHGTFIIVNMEMNRTNK